MGAPEPKLAADGQPVYSKNTRNTKNILQRYHIVFLNYVAVKRLNSLCLGWNT